MGRADLHVHTSEGDGADSVESIFEHVSTATDLDVIALTEHDSLEVALRAREVWARRGYRFDFVPGVELTTLDGHLIALFIEEPIPSLRRVEETLEAVRRQGGLCFVPHPGNWLTRSVGPGTFERVASANSDNLRFDAIEIASASPGSRMHRAKGELLSRRYQIPGLGASDAHFRQAIGSAYTDFPGRSAIDLRRAILTGRVQAGSRAFPSLREIGLRRSLSLPLTGLRATPKNLGWRKTAWSFFSRYRR